MAPDHQPPSQQQQQQPTSTIIGPFVERAAQATAAPASSTQPQRPAPPSRHASAAAAGQLQQQLLDIRHKLAAAAGIKSTQQQQQTAASRHADAHLAAAQAAVSAAAAALTPTITGHACKVPAVKSLSAASKKPAKQLRATSSSSTAEEGPPAHQHASPQALHLSVSGCAAPGQRPKAAPDGAALALAGNGSACSPAADGGSSSSPAPFEPSGLLSTVWPAQYAACSSTTSIAEASAAAQLAARGILKRLRAQLRSRHGPPAFQRGPLPRPASPPPVVLTAELLLQHSDSGDAPQDVLMADLASRDISSIADAAAAAAVPADACDNGAPAPQQQQQPWGLGAFVSLVSLDLSDNRLACIAGLAALPSLQHLVVSANRLRDLSGLAHAQGCSQQQPAPAELLGDGAAGSSSGGSSSSVLAAAVDGADAAVQETAARATDANEAPGGQQQQHQCASEAAAAAPLLQPLPCTTTSFCLLEVLDVSYNMLTAEQLLGPWSPLGHLPRLAELHAAGNDMTVLPPQLGPFCSLVHLNVQHNALQLAALTALAQLPALQALELSHNPLTGQLATHEAAPHGFAELTHLDVSSSRIAASQQLQELLSGMARLQVLCVINTPLADAGGELLHLLQEGGVTVVASSPKQPPAASSKRRALSKPLQAVVTVAEVAGPSRVMAAASRAALVHLPHEQLVAAFDRVTAYIDSWQQQQQLAPVPEEGSEAWQEAADAGLEPGPGIDEDAPAIEDKTFLTGVGITAQLPGEDASGADVTASSSHTAAGGGDQGCWQDPTERLAIALGLDVALLAHKSGRVPGAPQSAIHRLRHSLTHPLVDPAAGQHPAQHHMRMTATAAGKLQPRPAQPLPQPIPVALSTRVQPVRQLEGELKSLQGRLSTLQGTLMQQLQAQATKLATGGAPAAAGTGSGGRCGSTSVRQDVAAQGAHRAAM